LSKLIHDVVYVINFLVVMDVDLHVEFCLNSQQQDMASEKPLQPAVGSL
jgi:hypothetical protein